MSWFNQQVDRTKRAINRYGTAWENVVKTGDLGQFGSEIGNSALDFYGVGDNTTARKYVNSEFYQTSFKVATGVGIASIGNKLPSSKPTKTDSNNSVPNSTNNIEPPNEEPKIEQALIIGALIFLL